MRTDTERLGADPHGSAPTEVPDPASTPGGTVLDRLETVTETVARFAAYLGGVGIACLVLATVTDVARRAAGMTSINGLVDLTEVALVFVVYFGFAQAEVDKTHIRTSFLTERLPDRVRRVVLAAVWALAFAFLLWAVVRTGQSAADSFHAGESRASQSGVPVWPARVMVSLGLLGLALQSLMNVIAAVRGRRSGGDR
ncbi:TRAP transporter small permease [Dactylosporangium sp. NPDC005572]|uniref:TRAP transporter small permease n=1 Tax=Dactylosporangium sp. NPDC005572 TaxID=3156889 RepID=UPI0033B3CB96